MSKIYIVTSGEYSSYRINAVFLSHERAMDFSSAGGGEIEEWDADSWKRDDGRFSFSFDRAGVITNERFAPQRDGSDSDFTAAKVYACDEKTIKVLVDTGDRDRAVKIASEAYMRFCASLDQAVSLVDQAPGACRWNVITIVAKILSGLEPNYTSNGSMVGGWVLKALAIKGEAAVSA